MTQSVILNLKAPTTLETGIAFTQGDYGEEAVLQILTKDDDTYITDALSASISFTRSDGYIVTGELTGGGGIYQYQFKGNELQSAGKAVAVVTLEFAGGRVSTGSFAFNVRYNPMFDRGIDAGPYIWELEKIVASAKSYIEYLEALIEQLKPGIGSTALTKADLVNGFDQVEAGIKALDAAAGKRLWDKFGDYILKKQIVNNLLATQPGNPLDATQGKILADKFAQLNSELKIKTLTLTGSMNSEIINTDIDQYCYVYKSGLAVTVCMFLHAKNLTGMDTILPDGGIPEEYRAKANLTFNITARDGGQWGTANFIPAAIRFNSSGKVEIATGTEKAKAIYIDGTFSYIAKS